MNVKNNRRKRDSMARITKVFLELVQEKEIGRISVTEICQKAGLNRATFYANYEDIYDLADKVMEDLSEQVNDIYRDELTVGYNSNDYAKLFRHIQQNQLFYRTCFKLGIANRPIVQYDTDQARKFFHNRDIPYHAEFFRAGLNRIIKMWLEGGCPPVC